MSRTTPPHVLTSSGPHVLTFFPPHVLPFQASLGSIPDAKLSTRKNPHMSVTVVRIGPDARAGSSRSALRPRGTRPPISTATMVFRARARADHE